MRTTIVVPDPLFKTAEKAAKKLGMSRSELYTTALNEYLKDKHFTAALDCVYKDQPSGLDPVLARLQAEARPKEKWYCSAGGE